jgi:hypothetical protein
MVKTKKNNTESTLDLTLDLSEPIEKRIASEKYPGDWENEATGQDPECYDPPSLSPHIFLERASGPGDSWTPLAPP